ncbi:MAG: LysE family translocator [Kiloniellales bacterium]|nr:LysE family translocator [Kiloniellales bacterium]
MSPEQVVAFLVFAFVAAVTPGPSNVLLTATGANVGLLRGLPCLFGVALGMGLMMSVVAFGLGGLVLGTPQVLQALNWVGAAFLLWLSWRIATAKGGGPTSEEKPVGFLGAAGFQWVNPKSWLVSASAAGTYLQAEAGSALLQALSFGTLFVLAALPSCLAWLAFGVVMQRLLRSERAARIFNLAMGALLAGSVVMILR